MPGQRIIIAGGSGFLGRNLERFLAEDGYDIRILSRHPRAGEIQWDATTLSDWCQELDGAMALINLAGRSVDCRYNEKNKREILNSRINSTRILHEAVAKCQNPPRVWLNSSSSTIYNDTRGNAPANTECENNVGDDFSMGVAKEWEREFFSVKHPSTVQTAMRVAIVMGVDGGAFPIMSKIARFGLCSPQGAGDQWISWIHIHDFCRSVKALLDDPIAGVVNICSPDPILNRDFNHLLRDHVKPWLTLPQPNWLLKFGAIFLRTETELVLKSRKVAPKRLLDSGFEFEFPTADAALAGLLGRRKSGPV